MYVNECRKLISGGGVIGELHCTFSKSAVDLSYEEVVSNG